MIRLHGTCCCWWAATNMLVDAVELGPVGHLGQRVLGRLLVQALAPLLQRGFRRGVVHQQHGPQRAAVAGHDGNGVGVDRHGPARAPGDRQPPQRLHLGVNGGGHRAILPRRSTRPFSFCMFSRSGDQGRAADALRRRCPSAARRRGSTA